jgi:putative transposase
MSRKPRFILPGIPQHVIQRGNNREPCFYAEQDSWRYLHDLKEAATHNQAAIHAYVLMTNHVHRLVTPGQPYSITPGRDPDFRVIGSYLLTPRLVHNGAAT